MESTLQSIENMESDLKSNWHKLKSNWNQVDINWNQFNNQKSNWNQVDVNWNHIGINLKSIWNQFKFNWNQFEINSTSIEIMLQHFIEDPDHKKITLIIRQKLFGGRGWPPTLIRTQLGACIYVCICLLIEFKFGASATFLGWLPSGYLTCDKHACFPILCGKQHKTLTTINKPFPSGVHCGWLILGFTTTTCKSKLQKRAMRRTWPCQSPSFHTKDWLKDC